MEWNGELGYITLVCNNSLELKQKNMCDIFACIIPRINYHQRNGSQHTEAVAWRCSVKKVFLEISQNSQENLCAKFFFLIKLQAWGLQLY